MRRWWTNEACAANPKIGISRFRKGDTYVIESTAWPLQSGNLFRSNTESLSGFGSGGHHWQYKKGGWKSCLLDGLSEFSPRKRILFSFRKSQRYFLFLLYAWGDIWNQHEEYRKCVRSVWRRLKRSLVMIRLGVNIRDWEWSYSIAKSSEFHLEIWLLLKGCVDRLAADYPGKRSAFLLFPCNRKSAARKATSESDNLYVPLLWQSPTCQMPPDRRETAVKELDLQEVVIYVQQMSTCTGKTSSSMRV